jgi:hypothetical protein
MNPHANCPANTATHLIFHAQLGSHQGLPDPFQHETIAL